MPSAMASSIRTSKKPNYWVSKSAMDQTDPQVEFVQPYRAWDNDAENQKDITWKFSSDTLMDEGIELVEIADVQGWDTDAEQQFLQPGYYKDDQETKEFTNYVIIPNFGWTEDEQRYQIDQVKDHLTEEFIQNIIFGPFEEPAGDSRPIDWQFKEDIGQFTNYIIQPANIWDTDADNQLSNPLYQGLPSDQGQDWIQLLITPVVVSQLYAWDNDGENQLDRSWRIGDDLSDTGVEKIFIYNDWSEIDSYQEIRGWVKDDNVADVIFLSTPLGYNLDYENQKLQLEWSKDQLVDDTIFIRIPIAYDQDYENQKLQLEWTVDKDQLDNQVELVEIADVQGWDTDADQQFDHTWRFSLDDVSDAGVENIIIYNDWNSDTEQQFNHTWTFGQDDQLDSEIEILPSIGAATDVILMSYSGWRYTPEHLMDEEVELIQLNPLVSYLNFWDNDAEHQLDNTWKTQDDNYDSMVENLPSLYVISSNTLMGYKGYYVSQKILAQYEDMPVLAPSIGMGTDIILMGYSGYSIKKSFMADEERAIQITLPLFAFDDDQYVMNQFTVKDQIEEFINTITFQIFDDSQDKYWDAYYKDDESDFGVEKIFNPANIWDNDAENQILNPNYIGIGSDQGQDWNLLIIVPPIVNQLYAWDNDADHQKDNSWRIGDDVADAGVEKITSYEAWDTDADNQFDHTWRFGQDDVLDSTVEFIQPYHAWDTDADNQKSNMLWFASDELLDNREELIEPYLGWDTDADQQFDRTWRFSSDDVFDNRIELVEPYQAFDTDAEQQFDHTLRFSSDTLTDEGVEFIQPYRAWDTDADQQLSNEVKVSNLASDPGEDTTNYIILPFNDWTTDAENQLANPPYQGLPSDQGQDWNLVIIVPPIVSQMYAWDTDADYQKNYSWQIGDDLSDTGVEKIFIYNDWSEDIQFSIRGEIKDELLADNIFIFTPLVYDLDYENQKLQSNWTTDRELSDPIVELVQIKDVYGWDTDAEQQFDTTFRFNSDDVVDPGVERIVIFNVWDTDAEQQFDHTLRAIDDNFDSDVEFITIYHGWDNDADQQFSNEVRVANISSDQGEDYTNYAIIPTVPLDTDAEQQLDHTWKIGDDNFDPNQEFIILQLGWDTDAEQQFDTSWKAVDHNFDEYIEYPIVIQGWDTDAENQIDTEWRFSSDDIADTSVERIQLPFNDWTTDAENQILNPLYSGPGFDQGQDWTQYIILPPPAGFVNFWDTDADNQLLWPSWHDKQQFGDEYTQLFVAPVPPLPICAHGLVSLIYAAVGAITAYITGSGSITEAAQTTGSIQSETNSSGEGKEGTTGSGSGRFRGCDN